ncbi:MAG TPA: VWA domain-containing protein [Pirellulaceae bacterium]|nr:VWA domain-containing protein [Pirellulaceae bacterium]
MNDELPDPLLDAKLRQVPLPEDLLARLRSMSVPDTGELDQALREVPLPSNFLLRLRAGVDELIIDDALGDVAVPADLLAKLHVIPETREPAPWRRMALAASLLLIVGGLYGLTLSSLINAVRPRTAVVEKLPLIDLGPLQLELRESQALAVHLPRDSYRPAHFSPSRAETDALSVELIPFGRRVSLGAAGQMRELLATDFKPDDDVFSLRWGALGSPHFGGSRDPDLERVTSPRSPGIDLPLVRGYDRPFWLKNGVHPPISPAIHPALKTSRVAPSNRTDSVELTRRRIKARRLPDEANIRVEDFLAAVDYHFPSPLHGAVAIRTAAGPALYEQQTCQLLQVGLKVSRAPRLHAATHLTVALDISTSMGSGDRLEVAKRAIAKLVKYAGPDDRISLVVFHHDVVHLVESLNGEQLDQLPAIVAPLQATGGDNLAGGLQQAVFILLGSGLDDQFARNLVVLTDGQNDLPSEAKKLAGSVLGVAEEHSIKTTIVQIGALASEPPFFFELQDTGGVSWVQTQTSKDVLWELMEGLTGASVAVADRPVISVEFNPEAVQAYRLVGEGTTATSALDSLSETTTLHNDEDATALYEVWLHPNSHDEIAWVRAQWRDPQTGGHRESQRQLVSRLQFATSVGEMPLSLQAAAVAAEIGKILSGGYDFELSNASSFQRHKKSRDFRQLAEVCQKLNPSLDSWAEFRDLVGLIAAMDDVHRNQAP